MKRVTLIATVLLILSGTVLAYAFRPTADSHSPIRQQTYQARGFAQGLYPGLRKDIRVAVNNRTSRAVVLKRIKVKIRSANPGCGKRFLGLPGARGIKKMIPRRSRRGVTLKVKMFRSAPDACQGAIFPLDYRFKLGRPRR